MLNSQWLDEAQDVDRWLEDIRRFDDCRVEAIPFEESADWSFQQGALVHRTRRFFRIAGATWRDWRGVHRQPFIEERDIGTLGFIARRRSGELELLVQAKCEPGNVSYVQLAPTCHASASNMERSHGGEAAPFSGFLARPMAGCLASSLQSEQGTRFLGKLNRNLVVECEAPLQDSYFHRWLSFRLFAKFLAVDFLVNSAARSAICCTPWDRLVAHQPFSRARDGFDEELERSARAPRRQDHLQQLSDGLEAFRAKRPVTAPVGLDELPGWQLTRSALESGDGPAFRLRHIRVYARSREMREWDQPILESAGEGQADLCCGRDSGILRFAFRPSLEPGLRHGTELSPTFLSYPGDQTDKSWLHGLSGKVRLSCRQSDIGGRLFQDVTLYRIVDLGEATPFPGVVWLSLSEMMRLLPQSGWFSQEARTAISLLLSRI